MKIKCYCNLHVSDFVKGRKDAIIKGFMEGKFPSAVYVLTLAQGRQNHLEFFRAKLLRQPAYQKNQLFIVGLAKDQYDAQYVVKEIVQEVVDQTGGTDIRAYIEKQQQEFEEALKKKE